jgi:hypothetical protein
MDSVWLLPDEGADTPVIVERPEGQADEPWTAAALAQLETVPDGELAARIGRTVLAVRLMGTRRGIATAKDRRRI